MASDLDRNPVTGKANDQFGFGAHAPILCDAIQATVHLPLTIGNLRTMGHRKVQLSQYLPRAAHRPRPAPSWSSGFKVILAVEPPTAAHAYLIATTSDVSRFNQQGPPDAVPYGRRIPGPPDVRGAEVRLIGYVG
jgi:hypothetical protein